MTCLNPTREQAKRCKLLQGFVFWRFFRRIVRCYVSDSLKATNRKASQSLVHTPHAEIIGLPRPSQTWLALFWVLFGEHLLHQGRIRHISPTNYLLYVGVH